MWCYRLHVSWSEKYPVWASVNQNDEKNPWKLTAGSWKSPVWKGRSSSKPPIFGVPAVSFRGCRCWGSCIYSQDLWITYVLPCLFLKKRNMDSIWSTQPLEEGRIICFSLSRDHSKIEVNKSSTCFLFPSFFPGAKPPRSWARSCRPILCSSPKFQFQPWQHLKHWMRYQSVRLSELGTCRPPKLCSFMRSNIFALWSIYLLFVVTYKVSMMFHLWALCFIVSCSSVFVQKSTRKTCLLTSGSSHMTK